MKIEIKRLTPYYGEKYIEFFQTIFMDECSNWTTCYCRFYHIPGTIYDGKSTEEIQKETLQLISDGIIQGFIALVDDEIVGWLNVNNIHNYNYQMAEVKEKFKGRKYACIACFLIHSKYRRLGIAGEMLDFAINHLKDMGFAGIVALPFKETAPQDNFHGAESMYVKRGFHKIEEMKEYSILIQEWN